MMKFKDLGEKEVFNKSRELFGYPIMGGWLPYIGFKPITLTKEEILEITGCEVDEDVTFNPLVIEWFCRGASFGRLKIYPKD